MKSMWNEGDRERMLARIDAVQPAAQPRWGRMSADEMLAHLVQSMKMSLGEIPTKSKKLPLRYFPLKQLVVYLLPFPKGAPTARELLAGDASSTERSKEELRRLFDAFAKRRGQRVWPEHPAFGTLTERAWGVLTYRHFDHHLRQFGA
jgi:hypothetical protein